MLSDTIFDTARITRIAASIAISPCAKRSSFRCAHAIESPCYSVRIMGRDHKSPPLYTRIHMFAAYTGNSNNTLLAGARLVAANKPILAPVSAYDDGWIRLLCRHQLSYARRAAGDWAKPTTNRAGHIVAPAILYVKRYVTRLYHMWVLCMEHCVAFVLNVGCYLLF